MKSEVKQIKERICRKILQSFENRFQTDDFTDATKIFYTQNWPSDFVQKMSYGVNELKFLYNHFCMGFSDQKM